MNVLEPLAEFLVYNRHTSNDHQGELWEERLIQVVHVIVKGFQRGCLALQEKSQC